MTLLGVLKSKNSCFPEILLQMSVIVEWSFVISTLLMIGFKYWRILFILCFEHNYACAYMNTNSHLHMLIYLKLAYQSLNHHISLLTCVRYEIFLLLYIISSVIMVLNLNLIFWKFYDHVLLSWCPHTFDPPPPPPPPLHLGFTPHLD